MNPSSRCQGITSKGLSCRNDYRCQHHRHANQQHGTTGAGIGHTLNNIIRAAPHRLSLAFQGPRLGSTKRFSTFLHNQGSSEVAKLQVARKPIESGVRRALDTLSRGHFSKVATRLGYEDVYHNYLIFTLKNGAQYTVHKNEIIEERPTTKHDLAGENYSIPVPEHKTLKDMIDTASQSFSGPPGSIDANTHFWQYNPSGDNCQGFVQAVVDANHLKVDDEKARELIKPQDAGALINSLGALARIPKFITDTAATLDRVIHGDGLHHVGSGFRHHSSLFKNMLHK
jgi:hypothetical protein